MEKGEKNYYQILEISPTANQDEIYNGYIKAKNAYSQDSLALYSIMTKDQCNEIIKSIDEAYLDLTGTERLHGPAFAAAVKVRDTIMDKFELSASVGIASNRLMSKVASQLSKPCGIFHIYPGQEAAILAPLSPEALPGVGKVT